MSRNEKGVEHFSETGGAERPDSPLRSETVAVTDAFTADSASTSLAAAAAVAAPVAVAEEEKSEAAVAFFYNFESYCLCL